MPPPETGPPRAVVPLPSPRAGDGPAPTLTAPMTTTTDPAPVPGGVLTDRDAPAFDVHLDNFTGPFDLLLGLISRRRLEITEVALAAVTDEFIAHLRRMLAASDAADPSGAPGSDSGALGQASGFLVVAATLLDLKVARLLPADDDAALDADDLALVEARDLLFARLLQHRAYARVAEQLRQRLAEGARGVPRPGGAADPDLVRALPELVWATTPEQLAALAGAALSAPLRVPERVDVEHLHAPVVSVPEQVALLRERLVAAGAGAAVAFADLVGADDAVAVVVGRFLAALELYRRGEVDLDQPGPGAPLLLRWGGVVDLREPAS